jgi:hypothetical protein
VGGAHAVLTASAHDDTTLGRPRSQRVTRITGRSSAVTPSLLNTAPKGSIWDVEARTETAGGHRRTGQVYGLQAAQGE